MSRYFIGRARSFEEDDLYESQWNPFRGGIDVSDHEPFFTGLYDVKENRIMKAPRGIGFGIDIDG